MKNLIPLLILLISFNSCNSQSTKQNQNKSTKTEKNEISNVENTINEYDVIDRKAIQELTKKILKQDKAYVITSFSYKDKFYWLALDKKTKSKIGFYANKDLTNPKYINLKDAGYNGSYEYLVKQGIFKH